MDELDRRDGAGEGQDGPVHPVAQALRKTFDADNHHTLGSDPTGLMIDLSRVPFDASDHVGPPVTLPAAPPQVRVATAQVDKGKGRMGRLFRLFRRR